MPVRQKSTAQHRHQMTLGGERNHLPNLRTEAEELLHALHRPAGDFDGHRPVLARTAEHLRRAVLSEQLDRPELLTQRRTHLHARHCDQPAKGAYAPREPASNRRRVGLVGYTGRALSASRTGIIRTRWCSAWDSTTSAGSMLNARPGPTDATRTRVSLPRGARAVRAQRACGVWGGNPHRVRPKAAKEALRRAWDSNPRRRGTPHRFSRPAPSATRRALQRNVDQSARSPSSVGGHPCEGRRTLRGRWRTGRPRPDDILTLRFKCRAA